MYSEVAHKITEKCKQSQPIFASMRSHDTIIVQIYNNTVLFTIIVFEQHCIIRYAFYHYYTYLRGSSHGIV